MSLFGSVKDFAKGIGQDRSDHVVGVDVGTSSIKVVELKPGKDKKPELHTYGELFLGPLENKAVGEVVKFSPEKLSGAVKNLLTQSGVTTKNVGIALPFSSSLVTVVSVPKLDDEQLADLIPIEARKYIPVPVSEVYLDWQRIAPPKDSKPDPEEKVLLFAIHKNAVENYQSLVSRTELDATFYELEIFSTLRSAVGVSDQPVILADIGASYTKIYVALSGQIIATRKINTGSAHLSTALARLFSIPFAKAEEIKRAISLNSLRGGATQEEVVRFYESLVGEMQKTKDVFENSFGTKVSKALVTGGGCLIDGVESFVENKISLACSRAQPWTNVITPPFLEHLMEETGPEFCVAIGIALRKMQMRE